MNSAFELLQLGVPAAQIVTGKYHPSVLIRQMRFIERAEGILSLHRPTGLVEFLVFIGPRLKAVSQKEKGIEMVDPMDAKAAAFLAEFAKNSTFRKERPMDFWGGFFDSRIERVRYFRLQEMTTRLLAFLSVETIATADLTKMMLELSSEETTGIEEAIRKRPRLIVALAYAHLKERREAAHPPTRPPVKRAFNSPLSDLFDGPEEPVIPEARSDGENSEATGANLFDEVEEES